MIYAIRAVGTEYVKFGRAKHVGRRLVELDQACPLRLEIIETADWPDSAESTIHRLLADTRVKGEWFVYNDLAGEVIGWMSNKDAGLARLHHEYRKSGRVSWTASLKAQQSTAVNKRRKEREMYWAARGGV